MIIEISQCAKDLGLAYIDSWKQDKNLREALLSKLIVPVFYKYRNYLALMSKMHRADLEDCLLTHTNKYLIFLESINFSKNEIEQYKFEIKEIISSIKNHANESDFTLPEHDICSGLIYKIAHNAQVLIAEQSHNQLAKDTILASVIVFSFKLLMIDNHKLLLDHLFAVKEIWNIENPNEALETSVKYKFFHNLENFIDVDSIDNLETAFEQVINFFIIDNNILEHLSDVQLIHLYDRLKNIDPLSPIILNLLSLLHTESQYRYSYNRLSDTGYELLSRFQNFDALMHQVDDFGLSIIDSYLLGKTNIISLLLQRFVNKIEYLKVLGLTKDEHFLWITKNIETMIQNVSGHEQQGLKTLLDSLKNKLSNSFDLAVQKKFDVLDKYTINFLKKRYQILLENIHHLLEDNAIGKDFLREGFALKIASAYYFPNLSSSVEKIRKMAEDRKEVKSQLLEINLAEIFISPGILNKINSLDDFKNLALSPDIKSTTDFVHLVIGNLVSRCSTFQLEVLHKALLGQKDLTNHQLYLKNEVIKEALKRTTGGKKLFSIMLGRKKEYECLERIIASQ